MRISKESIYSLLQRSHDVISDLKIIISFRLPTVFRLFGYEKTNTVTIMDVKYKKESFIENIIVIGAVKYLQVNLQDNSK